MLKRLAAILCFSFFAVPAFAAVNDGAVTEAQESRESPQDRWWYFAGCVHTDFDCSWIATRYGFRDSHTEWDIRCPNAPYACYVSDER